MDEDSESEEFSTNEDDQTFFKTYGAIITNDPKIYDKQYKFYNENNLTEKKSKKKKKNEKLTLRDYQRDLVLKREGQLSEDEMDLTTFDENIKHKMYDQSTIENDSEIKKSFKKFLESDNSESDGEDLLIKRVKTIEEKKKEDDEFYTWLKGKNSIQIEDKNLKKLKKRWSKRESLNEEEQFLRDYLLEKQYEVNEEEETQNIPTYDEIIENEQYEKAAEEFEHKYNFRFEEPDQEFIKQYPRTVKESIRETKKRRRERRLEKKKLERDLLKKILKEPDSGLDNEVFKFRYRSVPANNFGLTTDEILLADDKELNSWVSVKKVCAYRSNEEEERDIKHFEKLAKNLDRKKKIFKTDPKTVEEKSNVEQLENQTDHDQETQKNEKIGKKQILRKRLKAKVKIKKGKLSSLKSLDKDRLKAYGVKTKKLKRLVYNKKLKNRTEKN